MRSMRDIGQRKKKSKYTLFRGGSSQSPSFENVLRHKHAVNTKLESILNDPNVVRELTCFHENFVKAPADKQNRSTEGCSKIKSPETRHVQERLVLTLEHLQSPMWDRTRCPEE